MQPTDLLPQLNDDIALARRLLELADQEFQALNARDMPRLEALLDEKQPLLTQLGQHGGQRSQLLAGRRLSVDRAGLASLLAGAPEQEQVLAAADALNVELEACRQANERNGRLIRANQTVLGGMLRILRGADTPSLYDSRGGAARGNRARPLSQA